MMWWYPMVQQKFLVSLSQKHKFSTNSVSRSIFREAAPTA
jgi:hypothetical protein